MEFFGFEFRPELYYTEHVWAKVETDGTVRIGFDGILAKAASEIFLIKLLPAGTNVKQKEKLGILESRKYTGPIPAPISGIIVATNDEIRRVGPQVLEDSYEKGWLCVIKPSNLEVDLKNLMYGDAALEWFKEEADASQWRKH